MAIPLTDYKKIKDQICIGYFATNEDSIHNYLSLAVPIIEKQLPGIKVSICCADNLKELNCFQKIKVIPQSELDAKIKNREFAYFKEITSSKHREIKELEGDMALNEANPVKILLDEADIEYPKNFFNFISINNITQESGDKTYIKKI